MKKETSNKENPAGGCTVLPAVRVEMPCGSTHSCHHCVHYCASVDWCSHLKRMTDEEFEAHERKLYTMLAHDG